MRGLPDNTSLKSRRLPRKSGPARSQAKAPRWKQQSCASAAGTGARLVSRSLYIKIVQASSEDLDIVVIVRLRVISGQWWGRCARWLSKQAHAFAEATSVYLAASGFAAALAGDFNGFENKLALDSKGQLGRAKDLVT